MVNVAINWSALTYAIGDALSAVIRATDSEGLPPSDLTWVLSRNGVPVARGATQSVSFQSSSSGLYRLTAIAGGVTADSAVNVGGGFEIQASPTPPDVDPTCVYLGALYSDEVTGPGGATPAVPYQLASYTQKVYLLPGTTHLSFDLDPEQDRVDDEVVVRTSTGNYALLGYPSGLFSENVGYDYTGGLPLLKAPADGVFQFTADAFNVHGSAAGDFSFRVRIKCWRQGPAVYKYTACPFTSHPGGVGNRHPKFAVLVTQMDVQTDVETRLNRLGSSAVNTYTVPEVTSMPLTVLTTDGAPNPVQTPTGLFFTDSNCYAVYEPQDDDLPELVARAVSGQDGLRPFFMTLEEPAPPPIIQRIKRLHGKLVVYMAKGALAAGSSITVRIATSRLIDGQRSVSFTLPVETGVYNGTDDTFKRITSTEIDISDFQFSENGVVADVSVDTSEASDDPLPCDDPDPIAADAYAYSTVKGRAIVFDGACYSDPVAQQTVSADNSPGAGWITGCHENMCGPLGLYCYNNTVSGSAATFRQPLYFPAPFVAYGSDPLSCYGGPILVSDTVTGTQHSELVTAQTAALCGDGYVYNQCAGQSSIVAVYPGSTVPHDVVNYGSSCWSLESGVALAGSTAAHLIGSLGWSAVSAGSVTPVLSCTEDECTGTAPDGSCVVYEDTQTGQQMHVRFEGLDMGVPFVAAAPQTRSPGPASLSRGSARVTFTAPRVHLFNCDVDGSVDFEFGLTEFDRKITVFRGAQTLTYELPAGRSTRSVNLHTGDRVYADIGGRSGLLSDRTRNKRATVTWDSVINLPRKYLTASIETAVANQVRGIGFTGVTNRSSYTLFRTLPQDVEQPFPNPDSLVTVSSGGAEYALVRTKAVGDPVCPLPRNVAWYSGEVLNGNLQFNFYALREHQGENGEVDVWLTESGTFPNFFKVDEFRTLSSSGSVFTRTGTAVSDISRNSLRKAFDGTSYHWPSRYVSNDGERITVREDEEVVVYAEKAYSRLSSDPGISANIVTASVSS